MKKLLDLSTDTIIRILLTAMDNNNWHTPGVGNLKIDKKFTSNACISGEFTSSLHNTYQNKKLNFEINKDAVRIWEKRSEINPRGDLITTRSYRPIYRIDKITEILSKIPNVINQ